MPIEEPDLSRLEGVVAPGILSAMNRASAMLTKAGIRHALIGGLAVGAHGYPRATKDVDFLVGDEAFDVHEGGIITSAKGVPLEIEKVAIDSLSILPEETHLVAAVDAPQVSHGVPVAPLGALIYTKLKSPRRKDAVDIIELVKAGIGVKKVRSYLSEKASSLLRKFDDLVNQAMEEMGS